MLVFVIDDDAHARDYFTSILQHERHEVVTFRDTIQAINYLVANPAPDVVLIDFRFEGGPNGLGLVEQVHLKYPNTGVVMVSGCADKQQIVEAFRRGADDFLIKPVDPAVVVDAIGRALLKRRAASPSQSAAQQIGDLFIDPHNRTASWHNIPLILTRTEFLLLHQLVVRVGKVINYAELYSVSNGQHLPPSDARSKLKSHVSNLRKKLIQANPDAPCPLHVVHGVGLRWLPNVLNVDGEDTE